MFIQSVASRTCAQHGGICPSAGRAEYPQRKTAMLNSWANVPPTQWPTVTPERDTDSTSLRGIINMDLLWRHTHMFHPPPSSSSSPPPLPPGDQRLNSPFFSETLKLEDFHLFTLIIRHHGATGCQFYISPPPTCSMGSCMYCIQHVHGAVINTGGTDWQTQSLKKAELFSKKHFTCYHDRKMSDWKIKSAGKG